MYINDLPSYNQALDLTKMENSPFYESVNYIDGYKVSVFNYRLATTRDFNYNGSLEMRGLTFVFNSDGTLFKRYLLMHKFFNLNQTENSLYDVVKNLKVKNVYNKEDGSLATFIRLPNGKTVGKTKMGFDNDQSSMINAIYNSQENVRNLVDYLLDNDLVPIFEYVAPDNKIVLNYFERKLILLKVRNNITGEYIDLDSIEADLEKVEKEYLNLDQLVELAKVMEDKEGWVVEFENGLTIKIKTEWYFRIHMLLTEDIQRENILIGYILDEKIDDVLSQVPINDLFTRNKIEDLTDIVLREVNELSILIEEAYNSFLNLNISEKEYAINYRIGNRLFAYVMLRIKNRKLRSMSLEEAISIYETYEKYEEVLKNTESFSIAKDAIRKETFRLMEAREWIQNVKQLNLIR